RGSLWFRLQHHLIGFRVPRFDGVLKNTVWLLVAKDLLEGETQILKEFKISRL
ncbi:hypothetical protein B484DRAFT_352348, partial [Ochromonadaceae sp. CCMP2298]